MHNTEKDLWLIIRDKIYNFSGYAKCHPGGASIFYDCAGKDATEAYEDSEHPAWADGQLQFYLVGEVLEQDPSSFAPIVSEAKVQQQTEEISDEISTNSSSSGSSTN